MLSIYCYKLEDHEKLRKKSREDNDRLIKRRGVLENKTMLIRENLLLAQIGSKLDNELVKRVIRGTTLEGNEAV